ncbi:hypothetical protein WN51_04957 [Melipona quadrifasciata]|uniref:Uncharacterized protein n=1 Tax=Melipona quadrifasciata TaxID=166423 RepID=A0A0M8ZRK3_9HYME|nr:hypothetical protein WN51_04957 [Melipona quadrifasciata]
MVGGRFQQTKATQFQFQQMGKKWNKKVDRNKEKERYRVDRTIVEVVIIAITPINSTSVHEKSRRLSAGFRYDMASEVQMVKILPKYPEIFNEGEAIKDSTSKGTLLLRKKPYRNFCNPEESMLLAAAVSSVTEQTTDAGTWLRGRISRKSREFPQFLNFRDTSERRGHDRIMAQPNGRLKRASSRSDATDRTVPLRPDSSSRWS